MAFDPQPLLSPARSLLLHDVRLEQLDLSTLPDASFDLDFYQHPDNYLDRTFDAFAGLVAAALATAGVIREVERTVLQPLERRFIPACLSLASRAVRRRAYRFLRERLFELWRSDQPGVQRRWFFLTLFDDRGNALEYASVLEVSRMKARFRKALAATGLAAMGFLEIQGLTNFPQSHDGGTLMLHAHALGFTDEPDFDIEAAVERAVAAGGLTNWLGARTVKIEEITQKGVLGRKAAYLMKLPAKGAYLADNAKTASGRSFRPADVKPAMALRLMEALSQVDYHEATWSVGRGNLIKTPWLRALREWHARRPDKPHSDHRFRSAYAAVWSSNNFRKRRRPVDMRRDAQRPLDEEWRLAADRSIIAREERRRKRAKARGERLL